RYILALAVQDNSAPVKPIQNRCSHTDREAGDQYRSEKPPERWPGVEEITEHRQGAILGNAVADQGIRSAEYCAHSGGGIGEGSEVEDTQEIDREQNSEKQEKILQQRSRGRGHFHVVNRDFVVLGSQLDYQESQEGQYHSIAGDACQQELVIRREQRVHRKCKVKPERSADGNEVNRKQQLGGLLPDGSVECAGVGQQEQEADFHQGVDSFR